MLGEEMTVDEVLEEVERDRAAYRKSGGGITVGGGEPLMQPEFVSKLLRECHERNINTVMETCGHAPWEYLRNVSQHLDLLYYDLKHMNSDKHKELTGVSNSLILSNLERALSGGVKCDIIVRTEIIPDYNDSDENITATASFVTEAGGTMMELLPYHALGSGKYRQLGMEYELPDISPPSDEEMTHLRSIVISLGLKEMSGVI